MKLVTVRCACSEAVQIDVDYARIQLRWRGAYDYGNRVSDHRAFVMRFVGLIGWRYIGGAIEAGKISMLCPRCSTKLLRNLVITEDA